MLPQPSILSVEEYFFVGEDEAPDILLPEHVQNAMAGTLSCQVPYQNGMVMVDEHVFASTRDQRARSETMHALNGVMNTAVTAAAQKDVQTAMDQFAAALCVRQVSQDPMAMSAMRMNAQQGDPQALAVCQAVQVMTASDAKDDAQCIAEGVAQGNPTSVATVNHLVCASENGDVPSQVMHTLIAQVIPDVPPPPPPPPPTPGVTGNPVGVMPPGLFPYVPGMSGVTGNVLPPLTAPGGPTRGGSMFGNLAGLLPPTTPIQPPLGAHPAQPSYGVASMDVAPPPILHPSTISLAPVQKPIR